MKKFKDTFRFVSSNQKLNKECGYYLDDRIVGPEVEMTLDYVKSMGVFYKIISIIGIFFGLSFFIEFMNEMTIVSNIYLNICSVIIIPLIFLWIIVLAICRDNQSYDKLEKYKENHWNFVLTEVSSLNKGIFETTVCFKDFKNSIILKNKYAKYLNENSKVYVMTIDKNCSDILVIFDWNGESYRDRGFQVNKVNI